MHFTIDCPNLYSNEFLIDIEIKRLQSELGAMQRAIIKERKIKISLCLFDIPTAYMDGIELMNNSLTYSGKVNLNYTRII